LFQALSRGIFLFSSRKKNTKKKKTIRKKKLCREGRELTFKLLFCLLTFGSRFYYLVFALSFQALSLGIFFSSKRKKNRKEQKNAEKGGSLPSSSRFAFSFLAPVFAFLLLPFPFKRFLLAFSSSQTEGKKNTRKKKTIEKNKNVEKGRSLPFFSCFYIWDEALFLLSPLHIPSTLSFPPSSSLGLRLLKTLCYSSSGAFPSFEDGMSGK